MKIKVKWEPHSVLNYVYPNVQSVKIDVKQGTIHFFDKENKTIDDGPISEVNLIEIEDVEPDNSAEVAKLQKTNEIESERALHYRTMWQQAIQSNHQLRVGELTREVALLKEALEQTKRQAHERDEQSLQLNTSLRNSITQLNEIVEGLKNENKFLHDFIQTKKGINNSDKEWCNNDW